MVNTISKGQVKVGKMFGDIVASAGSISSSEIAAGAVLTTHIAAEAVTSPKMSFSWSTMSNTTAGVTAITLPAAQGGYVITHIGAGSGIVVTSAGLSAPTAGDHYKFLYDVVASTKPLHFKSATATFDSTGAKVIGLEAAGQYFGIEALSSVRWVVTEFSTGLHYSLTT